MNDWDAPSVHKMYSIAEQCLHQKKNRRPDIKMVCSLSDKGFFWESVCVVTVPIIYISVSSLAGPTASTRDKNLICVSSDTQMSLEWSRHQ